jgi:hypothetical protein
MTATGQYELRLRFSHIVRWGSRPCQYRSHDPAVRRQGLRSSRRTTRSLKFSLHLGAGFAVDASFHDRPLRHTPIKLYEASFPRARGQPCQSPTPPPLNMLPQVAAGNAAANMFAREFSAKSSRVYAAGNGGDISGKSVAAKRDFRIYPRDFFFQKVREVFAEDFPERRKALCNPRKGNNRGAAALTATGAAAPL